VSDDTVCEQCGWLFTDDAESDAIIARLRTELATLHERLEDNRTYTGDGQRIEHEPGTIPDGIFCRDETIKLQDEYIETLEAELAEARKDAERYRHVRQAPKGWWEKLGDCLGESFDTAVDAAIAAALPEKS